MTTATLEPKRKSKIKLQPLNDRVVVVREEADERTSGGIVWITENAGKDGSLVCERIMEAAGNFGFNVVRDRYEDLAEAGVIDPTKVVRTALENAASVATLLLTSEALIAEKPREEKHKPGRGGDYDMY
jgi:chaperonin GroEL